MALNFNGNVIPAGSSDTGGVWFNGTQVYKINLDGNEVYSKSLFPGLSYSVNQWNAAFGSSTNWVAFNIPAGSYRVTANGSKGRNGMAYFTTSGVSSSGGAGGQGSKIVCTLNWPGGELWIKKPESSNGATMLAFNNLPTVESHYVVVASAGGNGGGSGQNRLNTSYTGGVGGPGGNATTFDITSASAPIRGGNGSIQNGTAGAAGYGGGNAYRSSSGFVVGAAGAGGTGAGSGYSGSAGKNMSNQGKGGDGAYSPGAVQDGGPGGSGGQGIVGGGGGGSGGRGTAGTNITTAQGAGGGGGGGGGGGLSYINQSIVTSASFALQNVNFGYETAGLSVTFITIENI